MKAARYRQIKRNHAGVPNKFVPKRGPRVPVLGVVPCLDCGADVSEPCRSAVGKEVKYHVSRRRKALRIYLAQKETA